MLACTCNSMQQFFSISSKILVVHNVTMQNGTQVITEPDQPCCFQIKLGSTKKHSKHAVCIPTIFETVSLFSTQLKTKCSYKYSKKKCWIGLQPAEPAGDVANFVNTADRFVTFKMSDKRTQASRRCHEIINCIQSTVSIPVDTINQNQ